MEINLIIPEYLQGVEVTESVLKQIVFQLVKDFELNSEQENAVLSKSLTLLNIQQWVEKVMFQKLENGSDLEQLLYRIDVPERTLEKVRNLKAEAYLKKLSEIILQRECIKVLTRIKFSS